MARHLQLIAFAAVAALLGVWLGEHPNAPLPVRDALTLVVIAIAAAWTMWSTGRSLSVLAGIGVTIVFCVPWLAGRHEANYALNDSVQNGEQVRESLAAYHTLHGRFPTALAELGIRIPGELSFPPHTLRYRSTANGYALSFSDWLAEHKASELHGFEVHK